MAAKWGLFSTFLIGTALASAAPSVAKRTEPPASTASPTADLSGVTVTAEKPNPLVDKTTEFVRKRLPVSRNEQYARFREGVCVKVVGLPGEFDGFIEKRVKDLAHKVDAPVDSSSSCKPNVSVIFSPAPQAQLTDIAKHRGLLFGFVFQTNAKEVATMRRPIQSWYLTRSVGTDGVGALEVNDPEACISSGVPGSPPCDIASPIVHGKPGSRLGNDMSTELMHSLILADSNKVSGQPIGAVADYIAVLALSRWQSLETCSGADTILNLMADECDDTRPAEATTSDIALLKALYSIDPRESGPLQRASMASAVRKAIADEQRASK